MITLFDRICYTEVGSEITHDGGQFWENNWSLSLYNDIIIGIKLLANDKADIYK